VLFFTATIARAADPAGSGAGPLPSWNDGKAKQSNIDFVMKVTTKFEMRDGKPLIMRLPEFNFNDDKAGKPVAINQHIGRRPIAAFGNSRGDQEMLEYTQGGSGARFELIVLHDDAAREYAYGPAQGLPDVKLGAFTQAVYDEAQKSGWTVVSMKNDWEQVFPAEKR